MAPPAQKKGSRNRRVPGGQRTSSMIRERLVCRQPRRILACSRLRSRGDLRVGCWNPFQQNEHAVRETSHGASFHANAFTFAVSRSVSTMCRPTSRTPSSLTRRENKPFPENGQGRFFTHSEVFSERVFFAAVWYNQRPAGEIRRIIMRKKLRRHPFQENVAVLRLGARAFENSECV